MSMSLPPGVQDSGLPFDLFIQSLTEQLDKAQAAMAIKARVAKLPLTFAVKDVQLDLRAFVQVIDDDLWIRPAGPNDHAASSLKLSLTTITKPMIEENAVDYAVSDPKLNLREALGDSLSDEDQRRLEKIGVHTVTQLNELKRSAGADVISRLSRMPVGRLQQALVKASAPIVTQVHTRRPAAPAPAPSTPVPRPAATPVKSTPTPAHTTIAVPPKASPSVVIRGANLLAGGKVPNITVGGAKVPLLRAQGDELEVHPEAHQLGQIAEVDFGDGRVHSFALGSIEDDAP